jgi:hypothetical protein
MLVLGVLIGASLAVASPSRPTRVLPSASPPVMAAPEGAGGDGGVAGSEGTTTEPQACAHAIAALAHEDHGLSHAIAGVLSKCKKNPQAPGLVNALLHRPGTEGKGGGESSHAGGASAGSGGPARTGTGGSEGTGSGGSGGGDSRGSGSDSSGSSGADKDNNGKAKGHYDGKGKNG